MTQQDSNFLVDVTDFLSTRAAVALFALKPLDASGVTEAEAEAAIRREADSRLTPQQRAWKAEAKRRASAGLPQLDVSSYPKGRPAQAAYQPTQGGRMATPKVVNKLEAAAAKATGKPGLWEKTQSLLSNATGGKVSSVADIANYVGSSTNRSVVVADALMGAGMHPNEVLPDDLIGSIPALQKAKERAMVRLGEMRVKYDAGSDHTLDAADPAKDLVDDMIRRRRVEAVLSVYGSESTYFLCHPNGGVPAADFVWYRKVIQGR